MATLEMQDTSLQDVEKCQSTCQMYHKTRPLTVYSESLIKNTPNYSIIVNRHRAFFLLWFAVFVVTSPLVFRYAMGTHTDNTWGDKISALEYLVLLVVFFDMLGNIFRGLPMLSGRPTELESSRCCNCNGSVVLGTSSPFVSEDEAVFLRSLIGRTCTLFHTCGGRHSLRGLYVDSILNEKRGKGEEVRKRLWHAWMRFLQALIATTLRRKAVTARESMSKHAKRKKRAIRRSVFMSDDILASNAPTPYDLNDTTMIRINQSTVLSTDNVTMTPIFRTYSVVYGVENTVTAKPDIASENGSTNTPYNANSSTEEASSNTSPASDAAPDIDAGNTEAEPVNATSDSFISPDGTLHADVQDIFSVISFLDHWLRIIKEQEWTYDYKQPNIFYAAPFFTYFDAADANTIYNEMNTLFVAFMNPNDLAPSNVSAPLSSNPLHSTCTPIATVAAPEDVPYHPDDLTEQHWVLTRDGLPTWNVTWSYYSRARVKPCSTNIDDNVPIVLESTCVVPGAVVIRKPDIDSAADVCLHDWLEARANVMQVLRIDANNNVVVKSFSTREITTLPMHCVSLLEQNRGKAGALNVYAEYLRCKAIQWCANKPPAQIFHGIIDARHMLAEPDIFWNDAIPFFSVNAETKKPTRRFGRASGDVPQCLLVQYPQFFSNVTRDDFLDNKNSAYYTVWQTLRDCAKTITSSGTNAIWDITDPTFSYATTSRIEDTGTTQKYLHSAITVHLPCFVAFGIAKQTEDYIEAVYRWSTGAVELFWSTLPTSSFMHFIVMAIFTAILALACFGDSCWWYYLWLLLLSSTAIVTASEKSRGKKPLRGFVVSSVIVMNTMYWISNLLSVFWTVIIPIQIAFIGEVPLGTNPTRGLFWIFGAVAIRYPPAAMADHMIVITRFLSKETRHWNYNMTLWRSSQLFACSFAYTLLSVITGTVNAVRSSFFHRDLTMWSSFRVSNQTLAKARQDLFNAMSSRSNIYHHAANVMKLTIQSMWSALTFPDVLTRWYSAGLFLLQIICIIVSINITNTDDTGAIIVTLVVCGLNLYLVIDIALLLMPSFTLLTGSTTRPEYIFAFIGVLIIISSGISKVVTFVAILEYMQLEP